MDKKEPHQWHVHFEYSAFDSHDGNVKAEYGITLNAKDYNDAVERARYYLPPLGAEVVRIFDYGPIEDDELPC